MKTGWRSPEEEDYGFPASPARRSDSSGRRGELRPMLHLMTVVLAALLGTVGGWLAGSLATSGSVVSLAKRVQTNEAGLKAAGGRLDIIERQDFNGIKGSVESLAKRVQANEAGLKAVEGSLKAVGGRLDIIERTDFNGLKGSVDSLTKRVQTSEDGLKAVGRRLDIIDGRNPKSIVSRLDAAESDIRVLEGRKK